MSDLPPHDLEAEMAALGAMMLSAAALADVLERISRADAFFRPAHQIIFGAIADMSAMAQPVDAVTVKAELERRKEITQAGGAPYLHTLLSACPVAASGGHYAGRVLERAAERRLGTAAVQIRQIAADQGLTIAERAERAQQALDEAAGASSRLRARSAAELIGPLMEQLESGTQAEQGIRTGWADLDEVIPGFRAGEMAVIGARPGMGKSLVMLNLAARAAIREHRPVLFCSLEMSWDECMQRILAAASGVSLTAMRTGTLEDRDWDAIAKAHVRIAQADTLMISDDPYMTVADIRAELRVMRRAGHPAELVEVDYLQLMTGRKRSESRQVEVSDFSRSLKLLAKEFAVPVIVGSQLNRGPEMRGDKRPLLADLRESGSLEQDSDIVILLYRDDLYVTDSPHAGEIELHVAKNRQGASGITATLAFHGAYARCTNLYRAPEAWTPTTALERAS